jgi:hypothetical protein
MVGKAVVSRNAFKGGVRPETRRLLSTANQLLRHQLEGLEGILDSSSS